MFKFSISLKFRLYDNDKQNKKKGCVSPQFFPSATQLVQSLTGLRAKSTINNYQTALRVFGRYAGTEVVISAVDAHLLEGFQQWLMERHVSPNTISYYMRSIRSLLYQMQPSCRHQDLFDNIYTGKMRTDKRSIAIDEIARLRHILLPPSSPLAFSRDIFLFSFYALGMPFVDVAFLQKQQCKDGYIVYDRHKTGQRVRVRIEPLMQQIIDRYSREDSIYVFPILTASDRDAREKEYESVRSRYNQHLRKLGEMMGLGRRLTSYVARHSWASIAYHANVDLSVISKDLGHTSPNTTLTYIREIDDNRIDMANKELLDRLML